MKRNVIEEKSFSFAVSILKLARELDGLKEYVIAKQILRAGTSIGANVNEAQNAISKKEFIAKMSIASKEARETEYWLRLLDAAPHIQLDLTVYKKEIDEILRLLVSIVKTSQENTK